MEKPREFDMTKTTYYMVPESPWDHLEVSSEAPSFSPVRVSTDDLYSAVRDPIDSVSRKEVGKKLLKGIKDQQFVIVQLSEDEVRVIVFFTLFFNALALDARRISLFRLYKGVLK